MSDGRRKEASENLGFPPKQGELMIKRFFLGEADENNWRLEGEELRWFDEVGAPGENWHYQQIAKVHYIRRT